MLPRVGFLGPAGTFSEEALLSSSMADAVEPVAFVMIYDTVMAVRRQEVQWAVAPIENSLDGSVTVTLDLLARRPRLPSKGQRGPPPPLLPLAGSVC